METPTAPALTAVAAAVAFVVPSVLTLMVPEMFSSAALPLMEASVFDSKYVTATDPLTPAIPPAAASVMASTVPYWVSAVTVTFSASTIFPAILA